MPYRPRKETDEGAGAREGEGARLKALIGKERSEATRAVSEARAQVSSMLHPPEWCIFLCKPLVLCSARAQISLTLHPLSDRVCRKRAEEKCEVAWQSKDAKLGPCRPRKSRTRTDRSRGFQVKTLRVELGEAKAKAKKYGAAAKKLKEQFKAKLGAYSVKIKTLDATLSRTKQVKFQRLVLKHALVDGTAM